MAKYTPLKRNHPRNTRRAYRDKTDLYNHLAWVQQERAAVHDAVSALRLELVHTTRLPGFVHRDYREQSREARSLLPRIMIENPVLVPLFLSGLVALAATLGEYYGR